MPRSLLTLILLFALLLPACTSQPTPTPTSTQTPPPTPTETPTPTPEKITLTGTFGLPAELAEKFKGAEKHITREQDGSYRVTASYRDPATGELQSINLEIIPDTFSANEDLKNPLTPLTVRAKTPENTSLKPTPTIDTAEQHPQRQNTEYTLIWNGKEFRVVPTLPIIAKDPNTKNPSFDYEAFNQIPRYTLEDVQSGFAVQSLLAHIIERMNAGESLAEILHMDPEATRDSWQRYGGNSLFFEMRNDGKFVRLKAKGNDRAYDGNLRYDNATMKVLPFGANIEINSQNYFAFYIANFDPIDPQNPDPNDLANWKFFLSIQTYALKPTDPTGLNAPNTWELNFRHQNPGVPYIFLYGDETFQQNHPLLAQLLSIPGNDASRMEYQDGYLDMQVNIENGMNHLPELRIIETQSLSRPLPPELQEMIFSFEVGVAQ